MKNLQLILPLLTIAATAPGAAFAQTPDIVKAMIEAARETGDAAQVDAVAAAAAAVFPDYAEDIVADAAMISADLAPVVGIEEPVVDEDAPAYVSQGLADFQGWTGSANIGALISSGNAENVSVGFGFDMSNQVGKFVHNLAGGINIASSSGVQTQKRWFAAYQLDYQFTDRTYAFGRISYDEDAFSGFDYRVFTGAGLGTFLYKSEPFTWKIEGGPGYQYSPIDDTREIQKQFAAYAATEIDWVLRDGLIFEQDFSTTWTSPTTTFLSRTALTTSLTESISTSLAYQVRYETSPPLGREKTDTTLSANVTYGF